MGATQKRRFIGVAIDLSGWDSCPGVEDAAVEPIHFRPGENFTCSSCARCCQGWRIAVDPRCESELRTLRLELRVLDPLVRQGGRSYANKDDQGRCAFLEDSRCQIHPIKPQGCRLFPFRLVRTPDGVFGGVSLYCSAAQRNQGQPLADHQGELQQLLGEALQVGERVPLDPSASLPWACYREWESLLLRELEGPEALQAPARALWTAAQAAPLGPAADLGWFELWEASREAVAPPLEPFALLERELFARLVVRAEFSEGERPAAARALLQGQPLHFRRFGQWRASLDDISAAAEPHPQLQRLLVNLVWRKWLVARRPLLHNLAVFYLLPRLFAFWQGLARLGEGAEQPHLRALDECEFRITTHARDIDEEYAHAARELGSLLDPHILPRNRFH